MQSAHAVFHVLCMFFLLIAGVADANKVNGDGDGDGNGNGNGVVRRVALFYIGSSSSASVAVSNGHTTACNSIAALIRQQQQHQQQPLGAVRIDIRNINEFSRLSRHQLVEREAAYIELISVHPDEYELRYRSIQSSRLQMDPELIETDLDLLKLATYLQDVDVVIGTHWMVPLAVQQLQAYGYAQHVAVSLAFTDYYSDNALVNRVAGCADRAFVGAGALRTNMLDALQQDGISAAATDASDRVLATGIPLSASVFVPVQKSAFLASKQLSGDSDMLTILLAGGSEGMGDFSTIVRVVSTELLRSPSRPFQFAIATGKNETQYRLLQTMLTNETRFGVRLERALSSDDFLSYVKCADLYIVKTGGLSPTEGAVIGAPMILLDIMGGHERDNSLFYQSLGIGLLNRDASQMGPLARAALFDAQVRARMQAAQLQFRQSRSMAPMTQFALTGQHDPELSTCHYSRVRTDDVRSLLRTLSVEDSRSESTILETGRDELDVYRDMRRRGILGVASAQQLLRAADTFSRALIVNPESYAAHFMLAHTNYLGQNLDAAMVHLNQSLHYDIADGIEGQYFHRAVYALERQNHVSAARDLLLALARAPLYPVGREEEYDDDDDNDNHSHDNNNGEHNSRDNQGDGSSYEQDVVKLLRAQVPYLAQSALLTEVRVALQPFHTMGVESSTRRNKMHAMSAAAASIRRNKMHILSAAY